MEITGTQRCIFCGRFLYNTDIALPFEIVSTGAMIMKMLLDINCPHCHRQHVYSVIPSFKVDK